MKLHRLLLSFLCLALPMLTLLTGNEMLHAASPAGENSASPLPASPRAEELELVGQYNTPVQAVEVRGSYAYLGSDNHLIILDISNPSEPRFVGQSQALPDRVYDVVVAGSYAYVAAGDGGLRVLDVSTPDTPREVTFFDTYHLAKAVALAGDYAYVADTVRYLPYPSNPDPNSGLRVIRIANPTELEQVAFLDVEGEINSVTLAGAYAYLGETYRGGGGLQVVTISNPSSPSAGDPATAIDKIYDIALAENHAYAALSNPNGRSGQIQVYDASDPARPYVRSYHDTPDEAFGIVVLSGYAYVSAGSSGLRLFNVSESIVPREVDFYDTPGEAQDLVVIRGYIYLADGEGGLIILRHPGALPTLDINLYLPLVESNRSPN